MNLKLLDDLNKLNKFYETLFNNLCIKDTEKCRVETFKHDLNQVIVTYLDFKESSFTTEEVNRLVLKDLNTLDKILKDEKNYFSELVKSRLKSMQARISLFNKSYWDKLDDDTEIIAVLNKERLNEMVKLTYDYNKYNYKNYEDDMQDMERLTLILTNELPLVRAWNEVFKFRHLMDFCESLNYKEIFIKRLNLRSSEDLKFDFSEIFITTKFGDNRIERNVEALFNEARPIVGLFKSEKYSWGDSETFLRFKF